MVTMVARLGMMWVTGGQGGDGMGDNNGHGGDDLCRSGGHGGMAWVTMVAKLGMLWFVT